MCSVILSVLILPFLVLVTALAILLPCCPRRAKQKTSATLVRHLLPFRYNVRVKGLELLPRDQGILFLPNHPALIDPIILISYLTKRFAVCPLAAEGQVAKKPWIFEMADTLPVPDFGQGTNSYTKHIMQETVLRTLATLEGGKSVLMYPAGRLMRTGTPFTELGTSATYDLLSQRQKERPWRVVLVHTHGLWGSRFSTAYTGTTPDFFTELRAGICDLLANLLLFMPKRNVDISFEEVELTGFQDKLEMNRWLMAKYNASGSEQLLQPGEEGYEKGKGRVPYRCCRKHSVKVLQAAQRAEAHKGEEELDHKDVQQVTAALAKHLGVSQDTLQLQKSLAHDLGMDSIQLGELIGWLDLEFNVQDVGATDLSTVGSVVEIATGRGSRQAAPSAGRAAPRGWEERLGKRPGLAQLSESSTLAEAFIKNAKRMGGSVMAGDDTSGIITYDKALIGAMLFANFLLRHPERIAQGRVGVMMPAAAGVGVLLMGVLLAGCAPVMVNWTVGRASLEHVLISTGIKTVITAARFLKKLGPEVDLSPLLERPGLLLFTEDLKANKFGGFGKRQKLAALLSAKRSAKALVQSYSLHAVSAEQEAVVLFTSGSENFPKGVQLSHRNVLTNIDGVLQAAQARQSDCLFGVLPPFHSFGFTVTTLGPVISGLKVAYYPNPTEYRRISREIARWRPTIYLGTPTFANGVLQASDADRRKTEAAFGRESGHPKPTGKKVAAVAPTPEVPFPTASLRLLVTGAEKTPEALFQFAKEQHTPPIDIIEGYGITETSPVLTANRPGKPRHGVGWAIHKTSLALLHIDKYLAKEIEVLAHCDEDHRVQGPVEKEGVIVCQGPGIFGAPGADPPRGYLGIPLSEKNPFVFAQNSWWYDTGDLGFFDEEGALHLSGRLKRFVKIAGEMVSLVSLESALKLRKLDDGSCPWGDTEEGPVVAVESFEADGTKPVLGLIASVEATLEEANEQLQVAGMPKIAKLSVLVDGRAAFEERWAKQGTLPLLGTGKSDYAQMKRALAEVVAKS